VEVRVPREVLVTAFIPLLIVLLSIPLILQRVPRNPIYGFRTPYTLSSDVVWYRANRICGVALTIAGTAWLLAGIVLPRFIGSPGRAFHLTALAGGAFVAAGCVVSLWLTYRK
jgi:uncharacterized membrane protein